MENSAILLTSWQRAQFLFDPQGQGLDAIKAITANGESQSPKIVALDMTKRSTDNEFIVSIERCIMDGLTLLVYNCSEVVDPILLTLIDLSGSFDESSRRVNGIRIQSLLVN